MTEAVKLTVDRAEGSNEGAVLIGPDGEHPVVQIPFTLLIDGRSYNGIGVSLVSANGLVT